SSDTSTSTPPPARPHSSQELPRPVNSSTSSGSAKALTCWISTNSQDHGCRRRSPPPGLIDSEAVVMAVRFRQQGVAQGHGVVVQETRLAQRMHAGAGGVHHQGGQAEVAFD